MKQKRVGGIELFLNNYLRVCCGLALIVMCNACASHQDDGYYKRANQASEKALDKLDRE